MNKKNPKISVIVPAYNAEKTLEQCLQALDNQSMPRHIYEIIVVNDGSKDKTELIAKRFADVVLNKKNEGPAYARNLGINIAKGDIILFTDSDCEPHSDWMREMISPFDDSEIVGVKGIYATKQKNIIARFAWVEYLTKYEIMKKSKYIDFVDTYSAGYRSWIFEKEGKFNTNFKVASGEDTEYSYRLSEKGYKMVLNSKAVIYHVFCTSLLSYLKRKFKIGYWRILLYKIHPKKMFVDSHTPNTLKIQVFLFLLSIPTVFGILFSSDFFKLHLSLLFLYLISCIKFIFFSLRKDFLVGVVSPFLLILRSAALGIGLIAGSVLFFRQNK